MVTVGQYALASSVALLSATFLSYEHMYKPEKLVSHFVSNPLKVMLLLNFLAICAYGVFWGLTSMFLGRLSADEMCKDRAANFLVVKSLVLLWLLGFSMGPSAVVWGSWILCIAVMMCFAAVAQRRRQLLSMMQLSRADTIRLVGFVCLVMSLTTTLLFLAVEAMPETDIRIVFFVISDALLVIVSLTHTFLRIGVEVYDSYWSADGGMEGGSPLCGSKPQALLLVDLGSDVASLSVTALQYASIWSHLGYALGLFPLFMGLELMQSVVRLWSKLRLFRSYWRMSHSVSERLAAMHSPTQAELNEAQATCGITFVRLYDEPAGNEAAGDSNKTTNNNNDDDDDAEDESAAEPASPRREETVRTPCGHYFLRSALQRWLQMPDSQGDCPICRQSLMDGTSPATRPPGRDEGPAGPGRHQHGPGAIRLPPMERGIGWQTLFRLDGQQGNFQLFPGLRFHVQRRVMHPGQQQQQQRGGAISEEVLEQRAGQVLDMFPNVSPNTVRHFLRRGAPVQAVVELALQGNIPPPQPHEVMPQTGVGRPQQQQQQQQQQQGEHLEGNDGAARSDPLPETAAAAHGGGGGAAAAAAAAGPSSWGEKRVSAMESAMAEETFEPIPEPSRAEFPDSFTFVEARRDVLRRRARQLYLKKRLQSKQAASARAGDGRDPPGPGEVVTPTPVSSEEAAASGNGLSVATSSLPARVEANYEEGEIARPHTPSREEIQRLAGEAALRRLAASSSRETTS